MMSHTRRQYYSSYSYENLRSEMKTDIFSVGGVLIVILYRVLETFLKLQFTLSVSGT
jgi:hypothetical protein